MNKDQYAKDFARLHASYEKQAYPVIKKSLDAQAKAVSDFIKKSDSNVLLLPVVLRALIDSRLTQEAYERTYAEIGVRHARHSARLLDRLTQPRKHGLPLLESKAVAFSSEYWREVMASYFRAEAAWKVTEVDDTTVLRIQKLLSEAQLQNLTVTQQAQYLARHLDDVRFNTVRAMLIARTESTVAANTAAFRVSEAADFVVVKRWLAGQDGRTRLSHRIVGNSDPIPLDALFEVPSPSGAGMERALYPGGQGLSVGNVARCRCSLVSEPLLDDSGLPVPKKIV